MHHLAARWTPVIRQMEESDDHLRFAALIGSYARQETPADRWSDLDLILVLDDPDRMFSDTSWLTAFGEPKIVFSQGLPVSCGRECRTLFADGSMLDVVIFATKEFAEALYDQAVQQIFSRGYQILCDKDGLTDSPRFNPAQPPIEESRESMISRFSNTVSCFWFHVVWTKMKLCRGEIMQSKNCMDRFMKDLLFDILRLKAKLVGGPASDTWHQARFFEKWVDDEDLKLLRLSYARYDKEDVGEALERTAVIFAKVAREVAALLDTSYPDDEETFAREIEILSGPPEPVKRNDIARYKPIREIEPALRESGDMPLYPVIRSMYLCVREMERAVAFYRRFLEAEPVERDEIYSVFNVGGLRLGLFAYKKMGEAHSFGDNCLPSIEVESEKQFLEKLQTVEVVYGPKPIGNILVAEFIDSEGNRIELTTQRESAG